MVPSSRSTTAFLTVDAPTLRRWADGFLIAKQVEGLASSTLKIYWENLSHFADYCEARNAAAQTAARRWPGCPVAVIAVWF